MQDSYFIYDYINFVKKLFITGLSKFISIYGSITYFDEKKYWRLSHLGKHLRLKQKKITIKMI